MHVRAHARACARGRGVCHPEEGPLGLELSAEVPEDPAVDRVERVKVVVRERRHHGVLLRACDRAALTKA
eukprot:450151-Pleurochrysis_carterae.AAC.1